MSRDQMQQCCHWRHLRCRLECKLPQLPAPPLCPPPYQQALGPAIPASGRAVVLSASSRTASDSCYSADNPIGSSMLKLAHALACVPGVWSATNACRVASACQGVGAPSWEPIAVPFVSFRRLESAWKDRMDEDICQRQVWPKAS